jgi:small subunit ribosomal protein S16
MAVSMRLKRIGNKHNAFYRVVVADSRSPRDGRFIEELGWYDPHKTEEKSDLNKERVEYWVSKGVIVSETVKSLLKKEGIAVS